MKKLNVSFLAVIAAITMAIGLVSCGGKSEFDSIDFLPVQLEKDGTWSFMDKNGKILYEGEFKNTPTLVMNGMFAVLEGDDGTYTLYEIKDKPVQVVSCEGLTSVGYYNEGLIPVAFKDERISVLNGKGEKKFELKPVNGKEITDCDVAYVEGMLAFKTEDGKCGFFDNEGKIAIEPVYIYVKGFMEGLALVVVPENENDESDYHWEVIDKKGELQFKIKKGYNPLVSGCFKNGKAPFLADDGSVVFYDTKGEKISLPSKVKNVLEYDENVVVFADAQNQVGVMTFDGEIIVRAKYNYVTILPDSKYLCGSKNEWHVLDKNGDKLFSTDNYERIINLFDWGLIGVNNSTGTYLDYEGKPKNREELINITLAPSPSWVVLSDYPGVNSKDN